MLLIIPWIFGTPVECGKNTIIRNHFIVKEFLKTVYPQQLIVNVGSNLNNIKYIAEEYN